MAPSKWRRYATRVAAPAALFLLLSPLPAAGQERMPDRFPSSAEAAAKLALVLEPVPTRSELPPPPIAGSRTREGWVVGLAAGAVAGGLAGYVAWTRSDRSEYAGCMGCEVISVGYIGLGALFGSVAGAFIGAAVDER